EVDQLAGDFDAVRLLAELLLRHLADGVESLVPAIGRDPIGHFRDRVLAVVLLARPGDVAVQASNRVPRRANRSGKVVDLEAEAARPNDLRVVQEGRVRALLPTRASAGGSCSGTRAGADAAGRSPSRFPRT